jgi:hypothetical protein
VSSCDLEEGFNEDQENIENAIRMMVSFVWAGATRILIYYYAVMKHRTHCYGIHIEFLNGFAVLEQRGRNLLSELATVLNSTRERLRGRQPGQFCENTAESTEFGDRSIVFTSGSMEIDHAVRVLA